jgi:hypothetical protein
MALRWTTTAMMEARKGFRWAYEQPPALRVALGGHYEKALALLTGKSMPPNLTRHSNRFDTFNRVRGANGLDCADGARAVAAEGGR